MSCGSIDEFKNILGDAFKDLKAALSCVDNTTVAIAEQQTALTSQLSAATSVITPEMVAMAFPAAPEFTYDDLQNYISGIGASIGDFASQAVGQAGSLVEALQTSIIGGQANYSLDSALGNGDTPQKEKFSSLTERTSSICETIGNGLVSIMGAIESTLAKIGEAVQEILAGTGVLVDAMRKVFTALSDAAAQVVQFVGDTIAAVAGAISEMVSAAAQAIKDAFYKGMELVFPTMGPDYTPPADLAGTEYI